MGMGCFSSISVSARAGKICVQMTLSKPLPRMYSYILSEPEVRY